LPDPTIEDFRSTPEAYGGLKLLCEQVVERYFPEKTLIVRPGLIVGPHDASDRFTYWPHRVSQGGEVLAPVSPDYTVQFIDVRDLADWTVRLTEQYATGIYNATGPVTPLPIGELLETARQVSQSDAQFTWVSDSFLQENKVEEYSELPLWVTEQEIGFNAFQNARAMNLGLTFRPLKETVSDTLAWAQSRPNHSFRAGLSPEREQKLLTLWHQQAN
jgi:2'-hydroxyisoflavone reductase